MKISKINLFALLFTILSFTSCQNKQLDTKPKPDCSTVFETSQNPNFEDSENISLCKVLPVKIDEETECEISGSDRIDNLIKLYGNVNDRTILIAPAKSLANDEMTSYKNLLNLYFMKLKIKRHLDSNIFDNLKDYRYKGMKCNVLGKKFVSWVGEGNVILALENQKESKVENKSEDQNQKQIENKETSPKETSKPEKKSPKKNKSRR